MHSLYLGSSRLYYDMERSGTSRMDRACGEAGSSVLCHPELSPISNNQERGKPNKRFILNFQRTQSHSPHSQEMTEAGRLLAV